MLAIHAIESRHAAWIRRLARSAPAANAFDPLSRTKVLDVVDRTHFVVRTSSRRRPPFTG